MPFAVRKPKLHYFCSRPVVDQKALVQDKSARSASKARADQENARVVIKMSGCAGDAKASTGSSSGSSPNPKRPPASQNGFSHLLVINDDGRAISARIPAIPARSPGKTALVSSHADTQKYSMNLYESMSLKMS